MVKPAVTLPAHPFLKWAGGKRQLLPELLKRVPASFDTYHEPFLGGGALFFTLRPKKAILSDANADLTMAYQTVKSQLKSLLLKLHDHETNFERGGLDYYLEIRSKSTGLPYSATAARMIFLNKTCFNGLYRVNSKGEFNVPMGKWKKTPLICDAENLRACSAALKGDISICCHDYKMALCFPVKGDFVYLDPPYLPRTESSSFTAFTKEGFGFKEHCELAKWVAKLKERGVHVLLSNAGTKSIRDLYPEPFFKIEEVSGRRSMSCHGDARNRVVEYLIS